MERREPGDLDAQIQELFGALTADLSIWRDLAGKYKPDLFVGLFMRKSNEGDEISAETLGLLSSRGVALSLDIYGPLTDLDGVPVAMNEMAKTSAKGRKRPPR